jgi:hypothetical protein
MWGYYSHQIMRTSVTTALISGLFLLAANVGAEEAAKPAGQPELAKLKTSVFKNKVTQLTDKQIAELYETYKDPKTGREYRIIASLARNPKNRKVGVVPFRLTATLYEYKTYRGKKIGQRQNGTIHIYLLDEAGKMVNEANVSLSKMCPG